MSLAGKKAQQRPCWKSQRPGRRNTHRLPGSWKYFSGLSPGLWGSSCFPNAQSIVKQEVLPHLIGPAPLYLKAVLMEQHSLFGKAALHSLARIRNEIPPSDRKRWKLFWYGAGCATWVTISIHPFERPTPAGCKQGMSPIYSSAYAAHFLHLLPE